MMNDTGRNTVEKVGLEALTSIGVLECLLPVFGSQLEDPVFRPVGEQDENISDISPGFDAVELAGGDERGEDTVPFTAVFTAQEEPIFSADNLLTEIELAEVMPIPGLCRVA